MRDWSGLLPDLLVEIAKRIQLVEDFVAFGGVCRSWRAAAVKDNFDNSRPQVPLLMLSEKKDSDEREFYSLSRKGGKFWTLLLPETKGKKCIESRGWFLTIDAVSGAMNLLHPFSRVHIQLPNQNDNPDYDEYSETVPSYLYIKRAVLSANPSETSDFILMLIGVFVGFWRPGDTSLTRIESANSFCDATYSNGKFYGINYRGDIWVWDVSIPDSPPVARKLFGIDQNLILCRELYIVKSGGELLILARDGCHNMNDGETYGATNFLIFQLDLVKRGWKEIMNLGERSIFVGYNDACSIDVTSSFPGIIKSNCIYFTDDSDEAYTNTESQQGGGKDMGIYHLEDGSIERFDDVQSFSLICPPMWVAPSL